MTRLAILMWLVLGHPVNAQERADATESSKTHMALAQQPAGAKQPGQRVTHHLLVVHQVHSGRAQGGLERALRRALM